MPNRNMKRAIVAQAITQFVPPGLRTELVEDPDFSSHFELTTDAVLTLGDGVLAIKRSAFCNAIRKCLSDRKNQEITDVSGNQWSLVYRENDGDPPTLELVNDNIEMNLPDFITLSPIRADRLDSLHRQARRYRLPQESLRAWEELLVKRPLNDDEAFELYDDIRDTPQHFVEGLSRQIVEGKGDVSSIVPRSLRYYERLLGEYSTASTIDELIRSTIPGDLGGEDESAVLENLLQALLVAPHSKAVERIPICQITTDHLRHILSFVARSGDPLSKAAAIELTLRAESDISVLEEELTALVTQLRDDKADNKESPISLFSALFILVDGELSRLRRFSDKPPFYRRFVSLTHAALIHRQFIIHQLKEESLIQWAIQQRGAQFYMQSLADMRLEPRWNPDLAAAAQLKAELIGRVLIAARTYSDKLLENDLGEFILGDGTDSLLNVCDFPAPYLPGPLEGASECPNPLPDELAQEIQSQLEDGTAGPASFTVLVNTALIFRIAAEHAEMASKVLSSANYQLEDIEDRRQLLAILNGLATASAVTRSKPLANTIRVLVRKYRLDREYAVTIEESLRIYLGAAGAYENLTEWSDYVGEAVRELSFSELNRDNAQVLYRYVECLCQAVPELWVTCSKAIAALRAYINKL